MNLSDLLTEGRLRKIEPDLQQANECIKAAERDVQFAEEAIGKNLDWALSIAYNSVLQSVRALMFADGFEASGEDHHKTTIGYAEVKFGANAKEEIAFMDRLRKRRHDVIYFSVGAVSEFEAKKAVEFAKRILRKAKEKMGK